MAFCSGLFSQHLKTMTMLTTSKATIMPMIPGRMYRSTKDAGCVGSDVGAAGAGSTANDVIACDGQ